MNQNSTPPPIVRFPAIKQRQMDRLLEKNREGTITVAEKAKLKALVADAEALILTNTKRLADFIRQSEN